MTNLSTDTTTVAVAARALKAFSKSFPDEMAIWIKQTETGIHEEAHCLDFVIQSILKTPKEEVTGAMIKREWINAEGIFLNH